MVSKARDDLPEPLGPVITTKRLRGNSQLIDFRLCSRAPRTINEAELSGMGAKYFTLSWCLLLRQSGVGMMGRVLLFAAIGLLSLAAALWLAPLQPGSTQEHSVASRQTQRAADLRAGQSGSANAKPSASGARLLPGESGDQAPTVEASQMGVQESALSVAACPSDMLFVGQPGFCIDRHEYPNLSGVIPATLISFAEAKKTCDAEGKRLCTDREWTQACLDLPAGTSEQQAYAAGRCNVAGLPIADGTDLTAMAEPEGVAKTLAMLDKRTHSGRMADCVSSSGVADLLGNVQEWVQSGNPSYEAAQKGGHFGTEAPSCRASSNVRHSHARHPGSGFRCCAGPLLRGPLRPVERNQPTP